jgi:hypothetical protein
MTVDSAKHASVRLSPSLLPSPALTVVNVLKGGRNRVRGGRRVKQIIQHTIKMLGRIVGVVDCQDQVVFAYIVERVDVSTHQP